MAKKGGSQLAQLKNKAVSEGLRGAQSGGKNRSSASGDAKAKRSDARTSLNDTFSTAFDTKVSKQKKDILTRASLQNKNVKGTVGRPSESKSAALAARQAALLPQLQDRHKSGAFVDRRFGENNPDMSVEQRMLERFTAERKRQLSNGSTATARRAGKASLFNLDDSEDEGLTHFGQSLSGMDDGMLGAGLGTDDEEDNAQPTYNPFDDEVPEGVAREDAEGKPRTKEDIMAEVMLKSKNAKYERQKAREQDEETRYELDEALEGIKHDLLMMQPAPAKPSEAKPAEPTAENPATGANAMPADGGSAYDSLYRSLVYERRAQPTDRLKTDEERAAEEAERLQAAERERLRRMRGDSDDENAAEDHAVAAGAGKRKRAKLMERREPGADDLDDDFAVDGVSAGEAYGLGSGLAGENESDKEEDDGDADEEGSEGSKGSEGEGSDPEEGDDEEASGSEDDDAEDIEDHEHNYNDLADLDGMAKPGEDMDSDEEAVAGAEAEALVGGSQKKKPVAQELKSNLPYTFAAPETHADFLDLLQNHNVETQQVPTVIKRIRTLYNPSLGPQNREHTETFLQVLVDHVLYLGGQAQQAADAHAPDSADLNSKEAISLLNTVLPHILELAKLYPDRAAQIFCTKLALMQRNLTRGLAAVAVGKSGRTWPSFAELSFLRTVGLVWPTSDRSHPVTSSAQILMAQYLTHARVRPESVVTDTASGLYLVSLTASNEQHSKRIVPEAINFLHLVLLGLAPLSESDRQAAYRTAAEYGVASSQEDLAALQSLRQKPKSKAAPVERDASLVIGENAWKARPNLIGLLTWKGDTKQAGSVLLSQALKLIEIFARLYTGCEAYIELFRPLAHIVSKPSTTELASLSQVLTKRIGNAQRTRRYLRLQAHRAKGIQMHAPKFSVSGISTDPDQERAEASKLRSLHKKERKSTIRELRRDARFTASIKDREQQEEDARYKKHIDRIMADLQTERSEEKKYEREKANLKRKR